MTRFRFRFDAQGMNLDVPKPAVIVAAAPIALDAVETPPDPAVVVTELKEWLDAHHDFGLDMSLLEQQEVLLAPPHWSYVSRAASSLLGRELAEPGTEEDRRQAVQKYVEMLAAREEILNYALAIAAYASTVAIGRDPAQRMRNALMALPKGAKMDPSFFETGPLLRPLPRLLAQGKAKQWADAVLARHEEIVDTTPHPPMPAVEEAGWKTWQKRLSDFHHSRRSFPVDENDLLLRARSAGPAALFWNELDQMPLRKWTDALLAASRSTDVPPWVRREVEMELVTDRKTVVIIVGDSESSPTAGWLPSKNVGSLWVARARWEEAYDALPAKPLREAAASVLAMEVAGDPDAVTQLITRHPSGVIGRIPSPAPFQVYLGKDKLPPQATPMVPYIEGAKDVDDVITKIAALTRLA